MIRRLLLAGALSALAGCSSYETPHFDGPQVLGGVEVPAAVLNRGARAYMTTCRPCHGHLGDGKGPQAVGMSPPPRDLRLGVVSFSSAPAGSIWRDEDVVRVARGGLAGTGMRAWTDVPEDELAAIVQFVKTLSPRFRTEVPAEAVAVSPDADRPLRVASDFGRLLEATDFRSGPLRAVRPGHRTEDLYRSIAAGLGGTAMPTWKGILPEEDLWALVHYVDGLSPEGPAGAR